MPQVYQSFIFCFIPNFPSISTKHSIPFFKLKYQSRLLHNAQVSGICKMRPKLSLKVFFFCFTHLIHSNSCERVSYTHPSPVYLSVSVCANLYFATKERLQIIHIFRFLFGIFEVWIACMYTAGCFAIGEDLSWTLNRCRTYQKSAKIARSVFVHFILYWENLS